MGEIEVGVFLTELIQSGSFRTKFGASERNCTWRHRDISCTSRPFELFQQLPPRCWKNDWSFSWGHVDSTN